MAAVALPAGVISEQVVIMQSIAVREPPFSPALTAKVYAMGTNTTAITVLLEKLVKKAGNRVMMRNIIVFCPLSKGSMMEVMSPGMPVDELPRGFRMVITDMTRNTTPQLMPLVNIS